VNNRLRMFVEDREDTQLLVGNGVAPNLEGILNVSGINTQAKGADSAPDAVYKGIVKCQTTSFLQPDSAVFNPLDWQDIRLLQTADGIYIFGPPSAPGPDRIWGLPVTLTTALTENTGLVGAFRASSQIFRRTGITLAVSDSHSDFFIKNKLMLRAEERIALVVFRPTGFCEVTGI
jgi:HK97 family phage major capsid protein